MPRDYKTKQGAKKRNKIDSQKLKKAVYDVVYSGKSIRGTANTYILSPMTLKRYVRKKKDAIAAGSASPEYEPNYRQSQIFSKEEETDLAEYFIKASKMHYGLTPKAARELTYEFAVKNNKKIPLNWEENKVASYEWLHGIMKRHSNLSLRTPEATSMSRATSFNRHNVSQFFFKLRSLYERFNFEARDIWNVDETGITTVHKPKKIIASKGLKQVSKVTSAERGELVTVCGAINAAGNHIPPFLIFPRKNWQPRMLENAPSGSDGAPYPSGWMTGPNFVRFLEHFKKNVRCSKDNPCLIILDNHESHISVESINFSKDNGIHLLTIPPHTSQKLQPLDRIVFSSLKSHYNTACDDWMLAHPARTLSIYELAGCLGKAYPNAMTPRNIIKSFEVSGIYPFNSDIFTDDEFLSCFVTDRPVEASGSKSSEIPEQTVTHAPEEYITDVSGAKNATIDVTDRPDDTITHILEEPVADRPVAATNNDITEMPEEFLTHGPEEVVTYASSAEDAACNDQQQQNLSSGRSSPSLLIQTPATARHILNEDPFVASLTGSESALTSFPTLAQLAIRSCRESYALANFLVDETATTPNIVHVTATASSSENTLTASAPSGTGTCVSVKTSASTKTLLIGALPRSDVMSANTTVTNQPDIPTNKISEAASKLASTSQRVLSPIAFTSLTNENYRTPTKTSKSSSRLSIFAPSTSNYISPEVIRPYPKAGPRKTVNKGRKKGSTKILTDTPEKIAIENEARERQDKKIKQLAASAKRKLEKEKTKMRPKTKKRRKYNDIYSSSEDEEYVIPPSPESDFRMSDLDDKEEVSENEDDYEENICEGDWIVVNFVSDKNLLHRYVGQITNESLASYDVKFAKKVTDTKFKWPDKPDISIISKYQVVSKIPPPIFKSSSKRVGIFQFQKSLKKFKIDK